MAGKYGPTRGEFVFRAVFSVLGLMAIGVLVAVRGVPKGPGLVEVFGIALAFFGGTLVHSLWQLRASAGRGRDRPE